jgi:hypothetical protein
MHLVEVVWMELAQHMLHRRVFRNMVMDSWVSQKQEFLYELSNYQFKEDPASWGKVTFVRI